MGLPWFRVDSNIGQHDKILALLSDPSAQRYQAFTSYICALGWSSGAGTDGRVPTFALKTCHGTSKTARLLVKHKLWTEAIAGYQIVNFDRRQQLMATRDAKDAMRAAASHKANCVRWHGDSCWRNGQCSKEETA